MLCDLCQSSPFQNKVHRVQYLYLCYCKGEKIALIVKRARIYDVLALLVVIVVIALDQWTKALVVANLSPPETRSPIPLIGDYLTIYYIQNSGAAFSLLANNTVLAVLIGLAICAIIYFYVRMFNTGPLAFKLIFGLIFGGAAGNLLDRALRGGYVVDFIFFRIPQIGYHFAIFNLADASISVGVFLLFLCIVFGGMRKTGGATNKHSGKEDSVSKDMIQIDSSESLRPTEQDVQS
ncbi:MAG: signal peptidase II [Chloroflexi bacterium]|nr:MAG: signal peptidase II [Chloroflexota bacterium]